MLPDGISSRDAPSISGASRMAFQTNPPYVPGKVWKMIATASVARLHVSGFSRAWSCCFIEVSADQRPIGVNIHASDIDDLRWIMPLSPVPCL